MKHHYKKLPVIIEAFQMTQAHRESNANWPQWLNEAWNRDPHEINAVYPVNHPNSDGTDPVVIRLSGGLQVVPWNDWIIKGVEGELYPCPHTVFCATYQKSSEVADPIVVDVMGDNQHNRVSIIWHGQGMMHYHKDNTE